MYGYSSGTSPTASIGPSCTDSPRSLPGSHSCVPWVPKCTIASAPKCWRAHRYTAR